MSTKRPVPTPVFLGDKLGTTMVSVFVGPKRKEFVIHEELLRSKWHLSNIHLGVGCEESVGRQIYLSEACPSAFSFFVQWMYSSGLPTMSANGKILISQSGKRIGPCSYLNALFELYFLAEKLNVEELSNKTIDRIQEVTKDIFEDDNSMEYCSFLEDFPTGMGPLKVYEMTRSGSKLRSYYICLMVFRAFKTYRYYGLCGKVLNKMSLESLLNIARSNKDIYLDFLLEFQEWNTSDDDNWPSAPYHRVNSKDTCKRYSTCYFHFHSNGKRCG